MLCQINNKGEEENVNINDEKEVKDEIMKQGMDQNCEGGSHGSTPQSVSSAQNPLVVKGQESISTQDKNNTLDDIDGTKYIKDSGN